MGQKIVYTCDVSGYTSEDAKEFFKVHVRAYPEQNYSSWNTFDETKLLHNDVALKLGFMKHHAKLETPEVVPSFGEALEALFTQHIDDILSDRGL